MLAAGGAGLSWRGVGVLGSEAHVLIGLLSQILASQPIRVRAVVSGVFVIVLGWPAFLAAGIFLYVYHTDTNVSIFEGDMIVFASLCKAQVDVAEFRTANCSSVRTLTCTKFTLSHTSCSSFLWFDPADTVDHIRYKH